MSTTLTTSVPVHPGSRLVTLRPLLRTHAGFAPTIARVTLGLVILPHGAQKTLGWFGGYGFTGTMHWFTETMQIPWILGFAAILAETLGGLALLVGFASRIAALGVGAIFVVAAATLHAQHGFFMNWFGNQKGEGVEYFVLGLALVAIVAVRGGGSLSVDRALSRNH
ncbi:MAG TPA: DoxX family protein [Opitutaceae bacterium]|nr:DoxX family protein [Opitutaceae bacterium]